MASRVFFDEIRSLNFSGISGSYANVGSSLTEQARMICFTNNTDGDVMFTDDGSTDKIFVASGSFKLWDLQANMNSQFDDKFVLPKGVQFEVKQVTAPSEGDVYIEVIY